MGKEIKVIEKEQGRVYHLERQRVLVATSVEDRTPTTSKQVETSYDGIIEPWETSNNYPREILKKMDGTIIPAALDFKSRACRSGGLVYGYVKGFDKSGREIFEPANIPDINTFLADNDLDSYFEEAFNDVFAFSHSFVEMIRNESRKKITTIVAQEATDCRFGVPNAKSNLINSVFVDGLWPDATKETWKKAPCVDTYFDVQGQIEALTRLKFMYPIRYSSYGRAIYQKPAWHSLFATKWPDLVKQIPEFKYYVMNNQMTVKYLIYVPDTWWNWKYPGFDKKKEAERVKIMDAELERFNNVLTGVKNAGKALLMTFKTYADGKEYAKWTVQILEDKLMSGAYIEDSQEGNMTILFNLNLDPVLIGNTPGKNMGAGSGSNDRVAFNKFIITHKPYQDKVLKPLDVIARYNKWSTPEKMIQWRFNNYLIATLDSGSDTQPKYKSA
jgi:hypothetical protein